MGNIQVTIQASGVTEAQAASFIANLKSAYASYNPQVSATYQSTLS